MGVSKTFYKHIVSKSFYKKIKKTTKTDFPRFFLSRFWAFLGEGSLKNPKQNIEKINMTLVLFWPLTHPPTTWVTAWRPRGTQLFLTNLGVVGWFLEGQKSTRVGQFFV
jgi:hypothetical protein